jgi:hypothetical protein
MPIYFCSSLFRAFFLKQLTVIHLHTNLCAVRELLVNLPSSFFPLPFNASMIWKNFWVLRIKSSKSDQLVKECVPVFKHTVWTIKSMDTSGRTGRRAAASLTWCFDWRSAGCSGYVREWMNVCVANVCDFKVTNKLKNYACIQIFVQNKINKIKNRVAYPLLILFSFQNLGIKYSANNK